ncbi:MAG TPA: ATP-binding cassette domain-containing protein, partial [Pyrinomonadaceae bacterium]|nr:ATP-binding cassette domain-containing protein [Pyrinomonadaceae bacterium]
HTDVGYPDKVLARDISVVLRRGECLGIIGPNGSGKTTFLRTILKKIPALAGEVQWGTKVQIGYYAQQLDDLDDRNEIIMELRRVAPSSATAGELRGFLAKFLFTGDDVYKHVRDLSGGEKGRLALAKLIYSRVNVLVLDEPTNHLDIPSREALEEALDAFEGTIVTISHDRYFLDRVATQILALDGEGVAEHYDGDYTEYHDWKANRTSGAAVAFPEKKGIGSEGAAAMKLVSAPSQMESKAPAGKQKQSGKGREVSSKTPAIKVIKKNRAEKLRPELLEADIAKTEQRLNEISERMAEPEVARDATELVKLDQEYKQAEAELATLYEQWEKTAAQG